MKMKLSRLAGNIGVATLFSLAADSDASTLVVWGNNYYHQTNVPPGLTDVVGIAAGYAHSVVLKADGTVATWGAYEVYHDPWDYTNYPATDPPGLSNVVAVAAGNLHSLALKADGTVAAWGISTVGQTNVPEGLSNVVAIAAGGNASLALKSDGSVVSWGPAAIEAPEGLTNVVAIGAGGGGIALKANGSVVVWGPWQDCGTNTASGLTDVVAVAGGAYSGWLALRADGTVVNSFCGMPGDVTNAIAISGSSGLDGWFNLVLKADGTVTQWGYSEYTGPVPTGLSNVVAIAAGGSHSLALVGEGPPTRTVPLLNPVWNSDKFWIEAFTHSGRVYALEYKDSLADSDWTALPLVAGNGGVRTLTDPSASGAQRFYRVGQW